MKQLPAEISLVSIIGPFKRNLNVIFLPGGENLPGYPLVFIYVRRYCKMNLSRTYAPKVGWAGAMFNKESGTQTLKGGIT